MKLGKTYKAMGTICIITDDNGRAREYLKKAYKIFESKGMSKYMAEISAKLKSVNAGKDSEPADKEPAKPKKKVKKRIIK